MSRFRLITLLCVALTAALVATRGASAQGDLDGLRFASVDTSMGQIVLLLDEERAPITVESFITSVEAGYYDGLLLHRVIANPNAPDRVVQGGVFDATYGVRPWREGLTGLTNEWQNGLINERGTIAMARQRDANSALTQFFFNHADNFDLSQPLVGGAGYAVFGAVIDGMDVVDAMSLVATARKTTKQFSIVLRDAPDEEIIIDSVRMMESGDLGDEAIEAARAWDERVAGMDDRLATFQEERELAANRRLWFREWRGELQNQGVASRREQYPAELERLEEVLAEIESVPADGEGVKVSVTDEGEGRAVTEDDVIVFDFAGWTIGDQEQVFAATALENNGFARAASVNALPGYDRTRPLAPVVEAVTGTNVGSRLLVYIPSLLAYGASGTPRPPVPPNSDLLMEIEIEDVLPTFEEMRAALEDARTTESGIEYAILKDGTSSGPTEIEDRVTTVYAGFLDQNGALFDAGLAQFHVGGVIQGWQQTLLDMRVGEARVIRLPGELGYGERGSPPRIPPNADLVFYIKLKSFDSFAPVVQQKLEESKSEGDADG